MYGGSVEDYLPDVEINSAIIDVFRVFSDMSTQWRHTGAAGGVSGFDYSALPFVLSCHGLQPDSQFLRDLRVMEAAALSEINRQE